MHASNELVTNSCDKKNDSKAHTIEAVKSISMKHVNYQGYTCPEQPIGVLDINFPVNVHSASEGMVVGMMSLRHLLYTYVKLSDDIHLFFEIHQAEAMGDVEVVIPKASQATDMIDSMNKNPAAFLFYYL